MTRLPDGTMREALIDTAAITENVRHLRRLTESEVIAIVKADGYGHGAVRSAIAALAGGATRLGVADISEAIALRRAGISAPILAWLHAPGASFAEAAALGIELGISSFAQLQAAASAASAERAVAVHLKAETGLGRNGIPPADLPVVFAEAASSGSASCASSGSSAPCPTRATPTIAPRSPASRMPSRSPRPTDSRRSCGTSRPRTPRSTCPRRASGACGWASRCTGSRRSRIARRPTSACARP